MSEAEPVKKPEPSTNPFNVLAASMKMKEKAKE
jgi:hypothetical protein